MRITQASQLLPLVQRGEQIIVTINGRPATAFAGETVAAVLLAEGQRAFRHTPKNGDPRGLFCGIGICYDCLVTVDGAPNMRACVTPVTAGMTIETHAEMRL